MKVDAGVWQEHVAAIKRESISASAYARRHGLSVAALYYWQRKLKAAPACAGSSVIGKFIALRIGDTTAPTPSACTLGLTSGVRLEMSALPSPEWLAALGSCTVGAR